MICSKLICLFRRYKQNLPKIRYGEYCILFYQDVYQRVCQKGFESRRYWGLHLELKIKHGLHTWCGRCANHEINLHMISTHTLCKPCLQWTYWCCVLHKVYLEQFVQTGSKHFETFAHNLQRVELRVPLLFDLGSSLCKVQFLSAQSGIGPRRSARRHRHLRVSPPGASWSGQWAGFGWSCTQVKTDKILVYTVCQNFQAMMGHRNIHDQWFG